LDFIALKSLKKSVFTAILFLAYGWVLLGSNVVFANTDRPISDFPVEGENYSVLSADYFFAARQSQSSISINFGNQFKATDGIDKLNHTTLLATNDLIISEFRQQDADAVNRLIEYRKADKLYPHHYFW